MSALISQWIGHVVEVFVSGIGDHLVASVPLEAGHPFYQPLHDASQSLAPQALESDQIISQISRIRSEIRDNFASFLAAVLKHAKGSVQHDAAEKAIEDFQLLVTVCSEANRLYGQSGQDGRYQNAFMNSFMIQLAKALVRSSNKAARFSPHPPRSNSSARSIRDTTRQTIERTFQISSSPVSEGDWQATASTSEYMVGDILWPIANILWRIYASRKLHTQASGLAKSFNGLKPHEDKRVTSRAPVIRQNDLCQSYYWRGKLGVVLLDMRNAKFWLDKAWKLCPETCYQQQRAILTRLIPVNLLLGLLPSQQTIQRFNMQPYLNLLHVFRTGNVPGFRKELMVNREWYRSRSVWLILYERGEILVWRNLLRRSLRLYYQDNPEVPRNRCPTWVFVNAASAAFKGSGEVEDGSISIEDIICVASSLIDQSLILGHLSYSQQQLVMKPSPDGMGGFPMISKVVPRHVEANV